MLQTYSSRICIKKIKMVSVCMITYNHEQYIERAIQGVLQQVADFEIELIISEDSSDDGTRYICSKYAHDYPEKVRLLPKAERKGMSKNFLDTIEACKSKYIAFCEGDDYWTDPNKLQMQVDFLQKNPSFALSSTRYWSREHTREVLLKDSMDKHFSNQCEGFVFESDSVIWDWTTKTLTVLLRKEAFEVDILKQYAYFRDTHLMFHVLQNGKGYCHNVFTGVYNIHEAGVWSLLSEERKALAACSVFEELSRLNHTNGVLWSRYLQSLRDYLNIKVDNSRKPLFSKTVYGLMWQYFKKIHSLSFLKSTFMRLIQKQYLKKIKPGT
jgi:glycosyltransferase involved in cell wall biosynthesis